MRNESYTSFSYFAAMVLSTSLVAHAGLAQSADWRSFGPPGGNVMTLAVDPLNSANVYAGTRGGAFKSTAGGAAWSNVDGGLGKSIVARLAIDPTDPSRLYASTLTPPRFYRSRDAGETWEVLQPGPYHQSPRAVVVDPTDGSRVYALLRPLFRSLDSGTSWEPLGLPGHPIALAVAPSDPDRLYSAVSAPQVFRSVDGGESWRTAGLNGAYVHGLSVDPVDADVVFANTFEDVFRSLDAGRSWTSVRNRLASQFPAEFFLQLLHAPSGTGTLYLVTTGRVLVSTDRGATWTTFGAVPPESPKRLAVAEDGTAYLGTECGVFRGSGGAWRAASGRLMATEVWGLAVDPVNPGNIYAGTLNCGRFRSVDGGVRWLRLAGPRESRKTLDMMIDPMNPGVRWYAATRGGLFRTVDGGDVWQRSFLDFAGSTSIGTTGQVAVAASDPRVVYTVLRNQLFRSVDRGESFSRIGIEDPARPGLARPYFDIVDVAIDPTDPAIVYAARLRLSKSTDGGHTWRFVGDTLGSVQSLAIDPSRPSTLYAVGQSLPGRGPLKVLKSEDGGETWRESADGLPEVRIVAVDPVSPETIYAGSVRDGVYVSFDGAETWEELGAVEPINFVRSLEASPTAVYAGTYRGILELPKNCGEGLTPVGEPVHLGAGTSPDVAVDGAGRFIAAWTAPDGTALGRVLDAVARPRAEAFELDGEDGRSPALAADGPGEFLAVWSRSSLPTNELMTRLYGAGGNPRGAARRIDREPRRTKLAPAAARSRTGEGVVVWESVSQQQRTLIRAQRLNARGVAVGAPITVRGQVDRAFAPAVAADAFGRFAVAWLELQAQQTSVRARGYQPSGAPRGAVVRLSSEEARVVEVGPAVAVAPTTEAIVGWLERTLDENQELVLRWLDSSGAPAGEQRLSAGGARGAAAFDVDMDRFGNTLVVWRAGDGGIRARIFDATGAPKGDEVALGDGSSLSVAYDLAGGAVVVWQDGGDVVAQRLRSTCTL